MNKPRRAKRGGIPKRNQASEKAPGIKAPELAANACEPWEDEEQWINQQWKSAKLKYAALLEARWPTSGGPALFHLAQAFSYLRLGRELTKHAKTPEDAARIQEQYETASAGELNEVTQAMLRALACDDEKFFTDIAMRAKRLIRSAATEALYSQTGTVATKEEQILDIAFDLLAGLGRTPTRDEVKTAVKNSDRDLGIVDKDWSGYFQRCGLDFLPKGKPGRPRSREAPMQEPIGKLDNEDAPF